jgi:soluble lytic murein transglycosylase
MHSQAKKITIQALLPLLLLLWGGSLWANISQQSDSRRSIFIAAEKALEQGDQAAYGELKRQLGDYPLTPYLEFQELTGSISRQKSADIERFLSQHSNTPLAARLKRIWLRELAKRKQWWTYLVFYRPTSDITLRCHQATALLETGKKQLAFSQAPEIWLSGRSRPDACDPLFKAWKAAGGLTGHAAKQQAADPLSQKAAASGAASGRGHLVHYSPFPRPACRHTEKTPAPTQRQ